MPICLKFVWHEVDGFLQDRYHQRLGNSAVTDKHSGGLCEEKMAPISVNSEQPLMVLVVSQARLLAESLSAALRDRGFMAQYEIPATGTRSKTLGSWHPDLVLLEVNFIEDQRHRPLLEQLWIAPVVLAMLGTKMDAHTFDACLDAGASIVLDMESPLDLVVESIQDVLSDRSSAERRTWSQLSSLRQKEEQSQLNRSTPFDYLTPRERQVLGEIIKGHSAESIANDSWVAVSTVRSQIKSILQKLGVNSQVAAVALARKAAWTPDEAPKSLRPPEGVSRRSGAELLNRLDAERFARKLA